MDISWSSDAGFILKPWNVRFYRSVHRIAGAVQLKLGSYDWYCAKIGIWCGKCRRKHLEVMFFFLTVSMFTFQHQDNWCPRTGGVEMSVGAVLTRQDFNQKVSVSADSYITGTLYMRKWCMIFVFGPKLVQFNPDFSWSVRVEANKHICEIISGMWDFLNSKLLSLVWECNQQTLLEHKTRCCWDLDGVPAF